VVEHDHGAAAGPEHSMYFAHCGGGIRRVVQNAMRVDQMEGVVWKVEPFGVGDAKRSGEIEKLKASACEVDGSVSQVDAGVAGARLGELSAVSAESTTDFKHVEICCLGEAGGCGNMPFFGVTMRLDEFVEVS